ncbi:unnamed protein product [Prorocentrum cordatum]|uniref:Uncharacterized protein n=1 Tax=Prorocentrum cordatum TaxID=2364126 RepID=A0ABN9WP99_9DINO|nr:unnamed protein product [Polarella glacialis]
MAHESEPAPDAGHVALLPASGGQVLVHKLTGEFVHLERLPQPWKLHEDDSGSCFVQSGETTAWVANKLRFPLHRGSADGEYDVDVGIGSEIKLVPLTQWLKGKNGDRDITINSPPHGDVKIHLYVTQPPRRGAAAWWDVECLYEQLRLRGKKAAGRWTVAGWQKWDEFLREKCALPGHLENKAPQGQRHRAAFLGMHILEDHRCADFRMASTHGLIALLARWSFGSQNFGGLSEGNRVSARGLLEALVSMSSLGDFTMFLADIRLGDEGWPAGSNGTTIEYSAARGLKLRPLTGKRNPLCRALTRLMPPSSLDEEGHARVLNLLEALVKTSLVDDTLTMIFQQLVWWVGKAADVAAVAQANGDDVVHASINSRTGNKMLTKYFISIQESFHRPTFLHVALDQGRPLIRLRPRRGYRLEQPGRAGYYMRYGENMNCEMFYDISHGVWRDQESALKEVELQAWTHLAVIMLNLLHSPWGSEARYCAISESSKEYAAHATCQCPLFRRYRDDLVADLDMSEELASKDLKEHEEFKLITKKIQEQPGYHNKGDNTKICRFANVTDVLADYDNRWTWATVRLLHYSLSEGFIDNVDWAALFKVSPSGGGTDGSEGGKLGVAKSNELVKKYRAALKSNVKLALAMKLNPTTRATGRILFTLVGPIRKWYGQQNKEMRSAPAMLKFMKAEVGDQKMREPLIQTVRLFEDSDVLDKIGLQTQFGEHHECFDEHHPWIADQDYLADLAVRYSLGLVAARFKRMEYLTHGWTGRQAEFLSTDPAVREKAEKDFFEEHAAYADAEKQTSGFWKKIVKRSQWKLVPTQQLLQMLTKNGGKSSPEMRKHIEQRLSGAGQSLISENCFGKCRRMENPAGNIQQQPTESFFANLINESVVGHLYNYHEPPWRDRVAPIGAEAILPKSLFKCALKDSPAWVGRITTKPDWFSTTATYSNVVFSDSFLVQVAKKSKAWGKVASGCFLAQLAGGRRLALRAVGSDQWYLSLGHQHGVVVVAWPCIAAFNGTVLASLKIDLEKAPCFLAVYDEKWMATTVKWCSPASAVAMKRATPEAMTERPVISAQVVTKPRKLMEEAAHNAFWDIRGPGLKLIMKHFGLEAGSDQSDLDRLLALLRKFLPKLTDEKLLEILGARLKTSSHLEDMLMLEETSDLLSKQDQEDFDKKVDTMTFQKKVVDEFLTDYTKLRAKMKHVKVEHKGVDGNLVKGRFPTGPVSQPDAQRLLPSPVRVYEDTANGRWQVYWPGLGSRSRSWQLHGHEDGLRQLLQWAWSEALSRAAQTTKDCPVKDLFKNVAAEGSAAAGSSSG